MSRLLKPHDIRAVEEDFDFSDPPIDPVNLSHMLARILIENEFFSLTANQVGLPHRAFVIRCQPIIAAFNPVILAEGEDVTTMEEGCGTYPDLVLEVPRHQVIRVRYTMPNGEKATERFTGLTARYFQQATDLLDGVHFTSRVNKYHLERAKRRARRRARGVYDSTRT